MLRLLLILISHTLFTQNIVIKNGNATEAFDRIPSSLSVGNPCGVPYFFSIFYDGNYMLKGDIHMYNAIVTIYGEVDYNGYEVVLFCENSEFNIEDISLSIPEFNKNEIKLYPNPTKGIFFITTKKKFTVNIYNMSGKFINNIPDLRNYPTGLYIVVISINGSIFRKKIIKK